MFVFQLGHMEQQLEELLGAIMSTCRYVVLHLIKYGNKFGLITTSSLFVFFSTAVAFYCKLNTLFEMYGLNGYNVLLRVEN